MPSARFTLGILYLTSVFFIGLWVREKGKLSAPAFSILVLIFTSLTCDILSYACYRAGVNYFAVQHLYTILEFFIQVQFIFLVHHSVFLRRLILVLLPSYTGLWMFSQFLPNALNEADDAMTLFSGILINAGIVFTLVSQMQRVSGELQDEWRFRTSGLVRETFRQLFLSVHGKFFLGLFTYNTVGLFIFAIHFAQPELSVQYPHSISLAAKHTFFLAAFLQSLRE